MRDAAEGGLDDCVARLDIGVMVGVPVLQSEASAHFDGASAALGGSQQGSGTTREELFELLGLEMQPIEVWETLLLLNTSPSFGEVGIDALPKQPARKLDNCLLLLL